MIGQTILHYRIESLIGEGGMGSVYLARDDSTGEAVAVKVLHSHLARDNETRSRFANESKIQSELHHPNIVNVREYVVDQDLVCMIMDYIEGKPLDMYIAENGPLSPSLCTEIILQVLRGLEFAHSRGIVHRDIKPSNILMSSDPQGNVSVKITDFGIAKAFKSDRKSTATGVMMGTISYMSPEQIESTKTVDHRADIYSVGATLYEMLTGTVPFDHDSLAEVIRLISKAKPTPPTRVSKKVPKRFNKIIETALAKEPYRRYQSATEFMTAVSNVKTGKDKAPAKTVAWQEQEEKAPPPKRQSKQRDPQKRLQTYLIAASVVLVAVLIILVGKIYEYETGGSKSSSSSESDRSSEGENIKTTPAVVKEYHPEGTKAVPWFMCLRGSS